MENIVAAKSTKLPTKLVVVGTVMLVLVLGLIASLFLVRQKQNVKEEAATPTGIVKVFITPETKTVQVGDEFTADILLDTAGQYVSALTIQLEYSYTGDDPPIDATDVQTSTDLMTNKEWSFPVKTTTTTGGKVVIRIAGFNKSTTGFKSTGEEKVATVTFEALSNGKIDATFNSSESRVTSKTTTQDILLIPSSKGTYTAQGGTDATASPTPSGSASPVPSGSASPSSSSTPSGSTTPSGSGSPAPIPVTGSSTPTLIGIGLGALLLIGSAVLIF
jgi:hypothetical protein